MLSPTDSVLASIAPQLAASIIPGPPPVITAKLASPKRRAVSTAFAYHGLAGARRADPKIATAVSTSDRLSNPSTNSPRIRKTRHGSVRVNAWRSRAGRDARRTSSAVRRSPIWGGGVSRREDIDGSLMIVGSVVEERGQAHMARSGIRHDAGLRQTPNLGLRISYRNHDDRRPTCRLHRHFRPEPSLRRTSDQVVRELAHGREHRVQPDFVQDIQPAKLCMHCRQRWRALFEAAGVAVQFERGAVKAEFLLV